MDNLSQFQTGQRIRLARETRQWTAETLAQKLHCSKYTVYHWERGNNQPTVKMRQKLQQIFPNLYLPYQPKDNSLGSKIHQIRVTYNLSLPDFATIMHIQPATVFAWERNHSRPQLTRLVYLSNHFKVSYQELTDPTVSLTIDAQTVLKYQKEG